MSDEEVARRQLWRTTYLTALADGHSLWDRGPYVDQQGRTTDSQEVVLGAAGPRPVESIYQLANNRLAEVSGAAKDQVLRHVENILRTHFPGGYERLEVYDQSHEYRVHAGGSAVHRGGEHQPRSQYLADLHALQYMHDDRRSRHGAGGAAAGDAHGVALDHYLEISNEYFF